MKFTPLIVLSFLFQMSACAPFYAYHYNLDEQIDEWLAENEFARIDDTMNFLSPLRSDYKKIESRETEIAGKKAAYIKAAITRAETLMAEDKWQQALDIYNEAQDKLADDATIAARKNTLIEERDTRVADLRRSMMLKRARALIQYQAIYGKLEKLIPVDETLRHEINKYRQEKQQLAAALMGIGENSLAADNYLLAEQCIDLSNQLAASSEKENSLDIIRKKKKHGEDRRRSSELLETYQKAYDNGDFLAARHHLETLIALDTGHEKALELKTTLDRDIALRVEEGIIRGKILYSQGHITEALAAWEELLEIDPANEELVSFIARAKKVSSKIKTLKSTGSK